MAISNLEIAFGGAILAYLIYKSKDTDSDRQPKVKNRINGSQLNISDLYTDIPKFYEDESYEQRAMRAKIISNTVEKIVEYSFYPIDNIRITHELEDLVRYKTHNTCMEETIYDSINTLLLGDKRIHQDHDALEHVAALAYMKMNGIVPRDGIALDVC